MIKYMNTAELAKYLDINEKKIYSLIREKKLPATKITGKWGFSKELVDRWLESSIENYPPFLKKQKGVLIVSGSNDPLFESLLNKPGKFENSISPFFCNTGSLDGLSMLNAGKVHISGSHLMDVDNSEYNISFIESRLPHLQVVAINFAYRQQGLIVDKGNPLKIKGCGDLGGSEVRFINRKKGSGTRLLLDRYLNNTGIDPLNVNGYELEANTHLEVGLAILKGEKDVGVGIKAIAISLNLDFIPLQQERFDLVIPKDYYFLEEVQQIISSLKSTQFRRDASNLGGYDTSSSGDIMYAS